MNEQANLMLSKDFLPVYAKLPTRIQKSIERLIDDFRANPHNPQLYIHELAAMMTDKKVRGAKLADGYRAIMVKPDRGNTWLLMHAASHDDAYAWAKNKRFEVHEKTGMLQVYDVERVTERVEETLQDDGPTTSSYPLSLLSDEELYLAGVPRPLIPAIRAISSDDQLDALASYLPQDCREVLLGIAAGMSLDEAIESTLGRDPRKDTTHPCEPGDFSRLADTPQFGVCLLDEKQEILAGALRGSLQEWRIFLHPCQQHLVRWKTRGPIKIFGAAGTGKTVVLLHRAVYLVRHREKPTDRILITTFTRNLAVSIRENLRALDPEQAKLIDVISLYSLAQKLCKGAGWSGDIVTLDQLTSYWDAIWHANPTLLASLPLTRDETEREYAEVIDPCGIVEESEYLTVIRSGRPRLSRDQRRELWKVFSGLDQALKDKGVMTPNRCVHEARLRVLADESLRYRHVLVDETQDLCLEALRFVAALSPSELACPPSDGEWSDPLCLTGDGHQRVYPHDIPLSRAGIRVQGRSRRLRINYRTTREIRTYAQNLLTGLSLDDLDGQQASTAGDTAMLSGMKPEIVPCITEADEARAIFEWITNLRSGADAMEDHAICIANPSDTVLSHLRSNGILVRQLRADEEDAGKAESGVRYGSFERIKGMEFRAVAIAGRELALHKPASASRQDRCQWYVAASRARDRLLVTVQGK